MTYSSWVWPLAIQRVTVPVAAARNKKRTTAIPTKRRLALHSRLLRLSSLFFQATEHIPPCTHSSPSLRPTTSNYNYTDTVYVTTMSEAPRRSTRLNKNQEDDTKGKAKAVDQDVEMEDTAADATSEPTEKVLTPKELEALVVAGSCPGN